MRLESSPATRHIGYLHRVRHAKFLECCSQGLGADEVVNYREQDFAALYADPSVHFDAVVDLIGGLLSTL